jgi:hypothetical protein
LSSAAAAVTASSIRFFAASEMPSEVSDTLGTLATKRSPMTPGILRTIDQATFRAKRTGELEVSFFGDSEVNIRNGDSGGPSRREE